APAIPQLHEIAPQRLIAVQVARLGRDERLQRVLGHAARSAKLDRLDVLTRLRRKLGRLGLLDLRLAGRSLSRRLLGLRGRRLRLSGRWWRSWRLPRKVLKRALLRLPRGLLLRGRGRGLGWSRRLRGGRASRGRGRARRRRLRGNPRNPRRAETSRDCEHAGAP